MVKPEWGVRRTCQSCSEKYYDLRKSPATCPKCGTIYEMILSGRGRRSKASALTDGKADVIDDLALVDDLELGDDLVVDDVVLEEDDEGSDDFGGIAERDLDDEDR